MAKIRKVSTAREVDKHLLHQGLRKVIRILKEEDSKFSMKVYVDGSDADIVCCNTAMCIGGHLAFIISNHTTQRDVSEFAHSLEFCGDFCLRSLFYPTDFGTRVFTKQQAIAAIKQYLKGNVDNPWLEV